MKKELNYLLTKRLPTIVGKFTTDHFKENFIKGGFVNKGLEKWKDPKRLNSESRYAADKYKTLLSSTNDLMESLRFEIHGNLVHIISDKPYAKIHNEGGVINIPITKKMRGFAWYKHKLETQDDKEKDTPWKGLALTKKQTLTVNMPQRKFAGESAELDEKVGKRLDVEMNKIFEKYPLLKKR